ncbi:MAG: 16S rRNA (cytosine(1402)-N(4))-methyltransferase RsmH [Planctomycetaceae bacterium]|nr:16S rRNA (cytosine(1402)-N(4))-methyltransferase RsmH [Planctomycetaceae bacterium]
MIDEVSNEPAESLDSTVHVPVMPSEVLSALDVRPGMIIVDGTLGGGGHSRMIASLVGPTGQVIGVDRDPLAVARTKETLRDLPVHTYAANYADIPEVLAECQIPLVDAILLDLGLSSDQLADRERGFSYLSDGELDLRFDTSTGTPAWMLVEKLSETHLADLIYKYGEERYSRRIARRIIQERQARPIRSARQLATLLRQCVPRSKNHSIDPATRTFQALRIAVNDELKWLEVALRRFPACLKPQGKLVVISFHSLEDRIVKNAFRDDPRLEVVTRKPLRPSDSEVESNNRSRSSRLRVAVRNDRSAEDIFVHAPQPGRR